MFGYLGLQYLLFWACLAATSTHVSADVTVAAFALSRILATVSVTPGGVGITESGTAALLVAMGVAGHQPRRLCCCSGSSPPPPRSRSAGSPG